MNLGQRIRQLRMRKKLSMEQLADELNKKYHSEDTSKPFGKGKISKWEAGKVDPSVSAIAKVAAYFDVSLDYLLGIEEKNTRYPVVEIPILSKVNKNDEMYEPENIVGYYYIPNNLKISHQKLIYLQVETLGDKELLLINLDDKAKDGETGLFLVNESENGIIRKVQDFGEQIMLSVENSNNIKPQLYDKENVENMGKVVSSISFSDDLDFNN